MHLFVVPLRPGDRLLLLWAKGRRFTVMPHGFSATYGGIAHSVLELTVVLENLAPGRRCGESCAYPGAASRVLARELLVRSPSVCLLEGWADEGYEDVQRRAWWCPIVPGSHNVGEDATVAGMVA
jgi:hypothetical protein